MSILSRVVPVLLLVAALAAAETVELKEQPFDIVQMKDGRTIEGTLLEQRTDGTLLFKPRASNEEIAIAAGTHSGVSYRRSVAQTTAAAAGAAIAANDQRRMVETLRWGQEKGAADAVMTQAALWLKQHPADRDVLEIIVPQLRAKPDWATLEAVARAGLAADRNWSDGDELVVEALTAQGRNQELDAYARQWLARNATALRANLICGASFENAGDLRAARECFRKAWEIHKNHAGALGLARTSLSTGHYADALRASQALIEAGQSVPEAQAFGGAAATALGDLATARPLLNGLDAAKLPAAAAQAGTYAQGLIAYRQGRMDEAARRWQSVPTPQAQFAAAIAQRREFSTPERLPEDFRPAARVLNASVRLENRQAQKALELIDQHLDARHGFLYMIGQVLTNSGSPDSIRALQVVRTPESLHWQLYGSILGGRYDAAEQIARAMPANDGYAMACRVFLAAARGDPEGARMLYEGSGGLPGAPPDFARRLAELYSTADDQVLVEPFDWPTGEVMATGWEVLTQGSGIAVRADGGKLVMEGVQATQADDPVTRTATMVPGSRFRLARLAVDISALGKGLAGLELLDGQRRNGVAIAASAASAKLQWRLLSLGKWNDWRDLPYAVDGTVAVMALDFSGGRIFAADPADPMRRTQLSDVLARSQGEWSLGVFGTAEPGTAWRASFDDLRWRLKPVK
jgi:tetratricopeptide (TPR) repeat protein